MNIGKLEIFMGTRKEKRKGGQKVLALSYILISWIMNGVLFDSLLTALNSLAYMIV